MHKILNHLRTDWYKYLLELIVITTGVLGAFGLNNWNEIRKEENIKEGYYYQLLTDLNSETENITKRISFLDSSIATYQAYEKLFENPQLSKWDIIDGLSKVNYTIAYLAFNTNTIETLQTTGDIKLIPVNIRNRLIELKRSQGLLLSIGQGNSQIYLNSQQRSLEAGFNPIFLRISSDKQPQIYSNFFEEVNWEEVILKKEASLALLNYTELERKEALRKMLKDIAEIIEMINKEFKK